VFVVIPDKTKINTTIMMAKGVPEFLRMYTLKEAHILTLSYSSSSIFLAIFSGSANYRVVDSTDSKSFVLLS
jgi:hypothetical protein